MKPQVRELSLAAAIREAYALGQEDEALEPIVKVDRRGRPLGRIRDGASVIFYDIRGEREIELTQSLIDRDFGYFDRGRRPFRLHFVSMITYDPFLKVGVAFPAQEKIRNTLVEILTREGLRVAKVAESEKAVHIGFFLNGKNGDPFPGEERFIVPSPQGAKSYAQTPEMSAAGVTREVISRINDAAFPVVIANLANVDVVGHIEDKAAVLRAIGAADSALGEIVTACRRSGATLVVTADHGTVEEWLYPDGSINTGHTKNPVPFILADFSDPGKIALRASGELADVAPTVLRLEGLDRAPEMTGEPLVVETPGGRRRRKLVLLILDGWGLRNETFGNIIREARTPHFDALWSQFPHCVIEAAGDAVGMPDRTVGNSEAGHLHLGAGRRVFSDRVRIDRAVADGSFFRNPAFLGAMAEAKKRARPLHLMGIISHYSSHGTLDHLFALMRMAKEQSVAEVYIHGFIGRRGERPESGAIYVEKVQEMGRGLGLGEVVTVMGRHWSLDREHNWDRIEKAYRALVQGLGTQVLG